MRDLIAREAMRQLSQARETDSKKLLCCNNIVLKVLQDIDDVLSWLLLLDSLLKHVQALQHRFAIHGWHRADVDARLRLVGVGVGRTRLRELDNALIPTDRLRRSQELE